jgi:hypothetical protein
MRRIDERYLGMFLSGEIDADMLRFRVAHPRDMREVCKELVTRLSLSSIRVGDCYPPEVLPAEILYAKTRDCLGQDVLARYVAKALVEEANRSVDQARELIDTLCQDKPEYLLKMIVNLSQCREPPTFTIAALHQLLDAVDESVWLDAAHTIKTKTELYHFTKWPTVLKILPKRDRGRILEGELGL